MSRRNVHSTQRRRKWIFNKRVVGVNLTHTRKVVVFCRVFQKTRSGNLLCESGSHLLVNNMMREDSWSILSHPFFINFDRLKHPAGSPTDEKMDQQPHLKNSFFPSVSIHLPMSPWSWSIQTSKEKTPKQMNSSWIQESKYQQGTDPDFNRSANKHGPSWPIRKKNKKTFASH